MKCNRCGREMRLIQNKTHNNKKGFTSIYLCKCGRMLGERVRDAIPYEINGERIIEIEDDGRTK